MVALAERTPYKTPSEASPTLLWVVHYHQGRGGQCFWAQHSSLPWPAPSVQRGSPSPLFPTIIGHLRSRRTTDTNRAQSWIHTTGIQWSDCGQIYQGHSTTKDPSLLSHQSRVAPALRQVAHPGPNSAEISSSNGGPQRNGDHCFLRREDWSRWISVATHLFQLAQNSFLAILAIYYF